MPFSLTLVKAGSLHVLLAITVLWKSRVVKNSRVWIWMLRRAPLAIHSG